MMGLVVTIHVIVCVVLITLILVQRGRGGGFIESFSGLESMFGTKTSEFLSRLTSILAVIFFITCLALAFLSLKESKSLLRGVKPRTLPVESVLPTNTSAITTLPVNATVSSEPKSPEAAQQAVPVTQAPSVAVNQTAE